MYFKVCKYQFIIHTFSFLFLLSELFLISALDNLGYGDFRKDAEDALAECKGMEKSFQMKLKLDRHLPPT